mmetsp:Transcript_32477/g.62389  ORF Transcript_32477/g.62389 Transcript_32477/m.62389 type:complete len:307 (-) Transcript_32477:329-1249(-)
MVEPYACLDHEVILCAEGTKQNGMMKPGLHEPLPEEMPGSSKFSSPTANVVGFERESSKNTQDYYQGVAFFFRSRDPKRKSEPPIVLHGTNLLGKFEEVADPGVVLVKGDNFLDMLGKMSNKDEGSSLIWSQNVYEAAPDSILDLKGCLDESQIIKRKDDKSSSCSQTPQLAYIDEDKFITPALSCCSTRNSLASASYKHSQEMEQSETPISAEASSSAFVVREAADEAEFAEEDLSHQTWNNEQPRSSASQGCVSSEQEVSTQQLLPDGSDYKILDKLSLITVSLGVIAAAWLAESRFHSGEGLL